MKFAGVHFVFVIGCCLLMLGCTSHSSSEKPSFQTFKDDLGREVQLPLHINRVVSLAPSVTEILFALHADAKVVSRTQTCDYPEKVKALPEVSTYPLDIESIVRLKPDVVFSVEGIVQPGQLQKLDELGIPVVFQRYESIQDIDSSILDIGSIIGASERAAFVVDSLHRELERIKVQSESGLSVLALTWLQPIYVYGVDTPLSSKLLYAGGRPAMTEKLHSPYPDVSREYLLQLNPDVLIGYGFERLDSSFFVMYPELKSITAYQKKQIFEVDDNLMSRPSPRYVQSIEELKAILSQCN